MLPFDERCSIVAVLMLLLSFTVNFTAFGCVPVYVDIVYRYILFGENLIMWCVWHGTEWILIIFLSCAQRRSGEAVEHNRFSQMNCENEYCTSKFRCRRDAHTYYIRIQKYTQMRSYLISTWVISVFLLSFSPSVFLSLLPPFCRSLSTPLFFHLLLSLAPYFPRLCCRCILHHSAMILPYLSIWLSMH